MEEYNKRTDNKRFVWQPHGSQFTIIEEVPKSTLILRLKQPKALGKDKILAPIEFDKTWVMAEKQKKNYINFTTASAQRSPSIAAEIIPPA